MKRKDLLLDFTSLLDVTLIVIFFFVLFSHLDSQENKEIMDGKIREMEEAVREADDSKAEYERLSAQLEQDIEIARESEGKLGDYTREIIEYRNSRNLKIILDMNEDGVNWAIRVICGDEMVSYLRNNDNIKSELIKVLEGAGYKPDETIFCDFVFDGKVSGTNKGYKQLEEQLEELKESYRLFYISETDLSIGAY